MSRLETGIASYLFLHRQDSALFLVEGVTHPSFSALTPAVVNS